MTNIEEIKNSYEGTPQYYLNWSGWKWWVRSCPGNPGNNKWSNNTDNVGVKDNMLYLTVKQVDGVWYSTEVDSVLNNFFHGVYKWTVKSPILKLDPNIVVALFFRYNDNNEIDIEATQWGCQEGNNLWFSVQPRGLSSAIDDLCPACDFEDLVYKFTWQPSFVHFSVELTDETVIAEWKCTDKSTIPRISGGVAMSMWLMNNQPPTIFDPSTSEVKIWIKHFSYEKSSQDQSEE